MADPGAADTRTIAGGQPRRAAGPAAEESRGGPRSRVSTSACRSATGLLPLTRYATLQVGDERRVVGYTEASRGCKHRCRHCPIVPGLRRAVSRRGGRRRARGHPGAGRRRRAAHHVRRSRLLQRHPARRGDRPGHRARVPGPDLRRHDQGRAPAAARRHAAGAAGHRLRVRDERGRVARRRRARPGSRRGTRGGLRAGGGALPRGRPAARADVRRVHAVDDAWRRTWNCCTRSIVSIWSRACRPFSSRFACSCRRARACWSSPRCGRAPARSIRSR